MAKDIFERLIEDHDKHRKLLDAIEQTSGDLLEVNYGTLYPALLKLEQEGYISSEWGVSENNRKAKFYTLTRAGRKQLEKQTREWERTTGIMDRFLSPGKAPS